MAAALAEQLRAMRVMFYDFGDGEEAETDSWQMPSMTAELNYLDDCFQKVVIRSGYGMATTHTRHAWGG
ncbi:hypothetical protein PCASD_06123 [Puccinia coronata f. sp. avenae]|uniref:Uncharacterized protein n=1 Tax=Puccinia coronata f. sp. avenae TaxID=200324 RepID=A0A2N5V000_9BASI|nr:hypothetical protein PCASD_12017 [Puccinia coronata f. sp. avenae]PLW43325.1 hypothetical protein PCASD_06123 [Puccinia coronata f. sp. avenae]